MSKISELSDGGSLLPTDFLIAVRSGGNVKVQADQTEFDRIRLGDGEKIELGNNQDLQIYHDGTDSYIDEQGTGTLNIRSSTTLRLQNAAGGNYLYGTVGGEVVLYYDGGSRLATSSSGVTVNGSVTATGSVTAGTNFTFANNNTDNTNKEGHFLARQYDSGTETEGFQVLQYFANSSVNRVDVGGASSAYNAATGINFYTAANTTTRTGAKRLGIASNGDVSLYEDTGTTAKLHWDASAESLGIGTSSLTTNATLSVGQGGVHVDGGASGGASQVILSTGASSGSNFGQISNTGTRWSLGYGGTPQTKGTEVLTWNSSGNVGIGVVPSATGAFIQSLQIGEQANLYSHVTGVGAGSSTYLSNNITNNSGPKYIKTDAGSEYVQQSGNHSWFTYPSGTAGAAATATERMRIDGASGNLLVGTTDSTPFDNSANSTADNGIAAGAGLFSAARYQGSVALLNRTGDDGEILGFKRSGANVGSLGNDGTDLTINSQGGMLKLFLAGSRNYNFDTSRFYPQTDNARDLGASSVRFKDLYLGGISYTNKVVAQTIFREGSNGSGLHFTTNAIYPTNETSAISDGTETLGAAAYRFKDLQLSGTAHANQYRLKNGTTTTGGLFHEKDLVGSGTSYDTSLFAETGNAIHFMVNGSATPIGTFLTSGEFLVGTTLTPSATQSGFMFSSDQLYTSAGSSTTNNYQVRFYNGNGLVGAITTDASATAYLTSSDQRLKENITDADDAGSKVDAIQVRKFDWKADGEHQDYGMIAQELIEVAPEAVSAPENPDEMMGVDYSKLVPMLVKEIQQLRQRVAQLEE